MAGPLAFSRLLIGFHQGSISRVTLRWAADFADRLGLGLHGLFVDDPALAWTAQQPGQREFHLLGGRWREMDLAALERETKHTALLASRLLAEAARAARVQSGFELVNASLADALGAAARQEDIVLVAEPVGPAERLADPFARVLRAAGASPAALLILPPRLAPAERRILALATGREDPCIAVAQALAGAMGGPLAVVEEPDDLQVGILPHEREAMIVATRPRRLERHAPLVGLAARRHVPLLLVPGPERAPDA